MLPASAPAQFGSVPGPTVAAAGVLTLLVPLALALWVGMDAADHSDHPLAWALATLVGGLSPLYVGSIAVVLLYRRTRDELGSIAPPSVRNESEIQRGEVLGEAVDQRRHAEREHAQGEVTDGGEAIPGTEPEGQAEWGSGDGAGSRDDEETKAPPSDDLGGFEMADPVDSDRAQ